MPHGGRLTIETALTIVGDPDGHGPQGVPPGPYVVLSLIDTGVGMDRGDQGPHLRSVLTRPKEVGKGTGLGLSTVYGSSSSAAARSAPRARG